jgi:hypothetical protein
MSHACQCNCTGDVDPGWTLPHGSVVLVAKTLTKSDCLGRVILPRVAVETNMSFLTSFRHPPPPAAPGPNPLLYLYKG